MNYQYEIIDYNDQLPIRIFMHRLERDMLHWHKELEVLLVVEGEINLFIDGVQYTLREGDIALVNSNKIHSTERTGNSNLVVTLQINTAYFARYNPNLSGLEFQCISQGKANKEFNYLRYCLANIMVEMAKKNSGYHFAANKFLNGFFCCLIRNFEFKEIVDKQDVSSEKDKERLLRILEYVKLNYQKKISLRELAGQEYLSLYYLSHYFKKKVGIGFQQYLNNTRLKAAVELLMYTDKQLIEIAELCGFSSLKLMTKIFREEFGTTPGEYRKKISKPTALLPMIGQSARHNQCAPTDLSKVLEYCQTVLETESNVSKIKNGKVINIVCDADAGINKLDHYFRKMATFSRAIEGLRADVQKQLRELQSEIGFEYIRFHGIFNDEMMIFSEAGDYNFSYVDQLFDFLLSVSFKPFIELSCMPDQLKSSEKTVFWWKGNVSPPNDIDRWCNLVDAFLRHCINRYGIAQVSQWYIEVWNEPDFADVFWAGTQRQYFDFYAATAGTVRLVCPALKVGGPAVTALAILDGGWIETFLRFCGDNKVPVDFISYHIYSEDKIAPQALSILGRDYVSDLIGKAAVQLKVAGQNIEINVTEWNISVINGNPVNDSCFAATALVKDIIQNQYKVHSLAHWTFTDLYEEYKVKKPELCGGFGLMSKNGLKKPTYWAYFFLSKLGKEVIYQDEFTIITKDGEELQILCYNHPVIAKAYEAKFIPKGAPYLFDIRIANVSGEYSLQRYILDEENGNAVTELNRLGVNCELTSNEIAYLKSKARPRYSRTQMSLEGRFNLQVQVESAGLNLILLQKLY